MTESERIVREALQQGLAEAVVGLYRVFTSPSHATDHEAAFLRGLSKHMLDYERMTELITQRKLT